MLPLYTLQRGMRCRKRQTVTNHAANPTFGIQLKVFSSQFRQRADENATDSYDKTEWT